MSQDSWLEIWWVFTS